MLLQYFMKLLFFLFLNITQWIPKKRFSLFTHSLTHPFTHFEFLRFLGMYLWVYINVSAHCRCMRKLKGYLHVRFKAICPGPFVSDMSASPGKFCSPSAGSEGAPGYRLRINEAANYIHLLRGSVPSNDPQHLRVPPPPPPPISFVFQKKELIIRKSHARRTNGRDLRRKITREYHFSLPTVWSRTPHRKPARLLRDPTEPHAARARHTTTESWEKDITNHDELTPSFSTLLILIESISQPLSTVKDCSNLGGQAGHDS